MFPKKMLAIFTAALGGFGLAKSINDCTKARKLEGYPGMNACRKIACSIARIKNWGDLEFALRLISVKQHLFGVIGSEFV